MKLKVSLMLILVMMLSIFTGCSTISKDLEVTKVTYGNMVAEKKDSSFIVKNNLGDVKVYSEIKSEFGSYQLIQKKVVDGISIGSGTKTYKCIAPKDTIQHQKLENLDINYEYKLTYQLFESTNCTGEAYDKVSISINTYDGLLANDLIQQVGGSRDYCNVDSNGNYAILNTNLFTQIAYSQIGYEYKTDEKSIDVCSATERKVGKYSKYGVLGEDGTTDLPFIQWVANKAKINFKVKDTVERQITWAKDSGRWYTDLNKIHEGDLRVFYDCVDKEKKLSIIYLKPSNNNIWADIYLSRGGVPEILTWEFAVDAKSHTDESTKLTRSYSGPFCAGAARSGSTEKRAVGFISMKGIAY